MENTEEKNVLNQSDNRDVEPRNEKADANEKEIAKDSFDVNEYKKISAALEKEEEKKKESFLARLLKKAKKIISVPVNYLIVKPITSIGENISFALMPKETKKQIYDEALKEVANERKKEFAQKEKEDALAVATKMKILRNDKLDNIEKMRELSQLCYDSKKTIIAKTEKGAFMFEKVGESVLIKHAKPTQRTLESKISYPFETIGGTVFDKKGNLKQLDLYDALKQLDIDNGFDKNSRSLESDIVIEKRGDYGYNETGDSKVELKDEDINKQILEGDKSAVEQAILKEIDVEDRQVVDPNLIKPETIDDIYAEAGISPDEKEITDEEVAKIMASIPVPVPPSELNISNSTIPVNEPIMEENTIENMINEANAKALANNEKAGKDEKMPVMEEEVR